MFKKWMIIILFIFISINNVYGLSEKDKKWNPIQDGGGRNILKEICEKRPDLPQCRENLEYPSSDALKGRTRINKHRESINYSCVEVQPYSGFATMVTYVFSFKFKMQLNKIVEDTVSVITGCNIDRWETCSTVCSGDSSGSGGESGESCETHCSEHCSANIECSDIVCTRPEPCTLNITITVTAYCNYFYLVKHHRCMPWYGIVDENNKELVKNPLEKFLNVQKDYLLGGLENGGQLLLQCVDECNDIIEHVGTEHTEEVRIDLDDPSCIWLDAPNNCIPTCSGCSC